MTGKIASMSVVALKSFKFPQKISWRGVLGQLLDNPSATRASIYLPAGAQARKGLGGNALAT